MLHVDVCSDFKKNGAGFGEIGFWGGFYHPTPLYTAKPVQVIYTLKVYMISMGSMA